MKDDEGIHTFEIYLITDKINVSFNETWDLRHTFILFFALNLLKKWFVVHTSSC